MTVKFRNRLSRIYQIWSRTRTSDYCIGYVSSRSFVFLEIVLSRDRDKQNDQGDHPVAEIVSSSHSSRQQSHIDILK